MSQTVYVMRHGRAESGAGRPDESRHLSADGARGMALVARGLQRMGLQLDTVLSSPLIRAYQTAEAIQMVVAPKVKIHESDALGPETNSHATIQVLQGLPKKAASILVVGHLPGIAGLLRTLVVGEEGGGFTFEPATLARVDFGDEVRAGRGTLRWLMAAQQLEALGEGN